MSKKIALWVGIGASIVAILIFAQNEYGKIAKAEDVKSLHESIKKTNKRLDKKILRDDIRYYQQRKLYMEEKYGEDAKDKYEYKCILEDIEALEDELKKEN